MEQLMPASVPLCGRRRIVRFGRRVGHPERDDAHARSAGQAGRRPQEASMCRRMAWHGQPVPIDEHTPRPLAVRAQRPHRQLLRRATRPELARGRRARHGVEFPVQGRHRHRRRRIAVAVRYSWEGRSRSLYASADVRPCACCTPTARTCSGWSRGTAQRCGAITPRGPDPIACGAARLHPRGAAGP